MPETIITIIDGGGGTTEVTITDAAPIELSTSGNTNVSVDVGAGGIAQVSSFDLVYEAAGGETQLTITGLANATFFLIFQGTTALKRYTGSLPVPSISYKRIGTTLYLGDVLAPDERLYFISNVALSIA